MKALNRALLVTQRHCIRPLWVQWRQYKWGVMGATKAFRGALWLQQRQYMGRYGCHEGTTSGGNGAVQALRGALWVP